METKKCLTCRTEFETNYPKKKYCSAKCKMDNFYKRQAEGQQIQMPIDQTQTISPPRTHKAEELTPPPSPKKEILMEENTNNNQLSMFDLFNEKLKIVELKNDMRFAQHKHEQEMAQMKEITRQAQEQARESLDLVNKFKQCKEKAEDDLIEQEQKNKTADVITGLAEKFIPLFINK